MLARPLGVVLLVLIAAPALAAAEDVVVTGGNGIIRAAPDLAYVTVATESRARNPKDAQRQNAATMTAVQAKLRGAGLPNDALRTLGYDVQEEADYVQGKRVPRGYLVRNTIEIRVDEIDRVGELVDLTIGSGATALSNIRFDLKNRDLLERDALKLAVADARARAQAAASGAGREISRILRIEDRQTAMVPPGPPIPMLRAMPAEAQTPIAAGPIEVRAEVTLTAALK